MLCRALRGGAADICCLPDVRARGLWGLHPPCLLPPWDLGDNGFVQSLGQGWAGGTVFPLRVCVGSCSSKLEKMPSIPEEPEQAETEAECFTMPDFLKPLHNLDVVESKEAVLECQVAGLPYPSITWFHNGSRIDSTDDRKMMQCRASCRPPCPLGVPPPGAEKGGTPREEGSSPRPSCPMRQGGQPCMAWLLVSYPCVPVPPPR